jgi:hypothetical protein
MHLNNPAAFKATHSAGNTDIVPISATHWVHYYSFSPSPMTTTYASNDTLMYCSAFNVRQWVAASSSACAIPAPSSSPAPITLLRASSPATAAGGVAYGQMPEPMRMLVGRSGMVAKGSAETVGPTVT